MVLASSGTSGQGPKEDSAGFSRAHCFRHWEVAVFGCCALCPDKGRPFKTKDLGSAHPRTSSSWHNTSEVITRRVSAYKRETSSATQ